MTQVKGDESLPFPLNIVELSFIISEMEWLNMILHGDLFDLVPALPDASLDTVICSPPYANQRSKQYGGISEVDYPEWTARWMAALRSKLKKNASIAIVIRPHVDHGQLSDYVLRTRLRVRQDWDEIEELIWIKPQAPPIGHVQRPRRSWESILWYCEGATPYCDTKPENIATGSHRLGMESKKGLTGGYIHSVREVRKGVARVRDYVEASVTEVNMDAFNTHPAQYPEKVADWLIRMLCPTDGVVFDPFSGSGTTLVAAKKANRAFSGTEIMEEYVSIANRRLANVLSTDDIFKF
jgi:site-specific DNA-methyltransferase (adenine-specific)/site-specific DNA-methyltransferase (cytosine-N4-specific)